MSLFTVHSAMVYVIQVGRQLSTRSRMALSFILLLVAYSLSHLHKMYQSRCTAKNSWWWAERLPETCRVVIPIKLEFTSSVGFIHKESVTMLGHTIMKKKLSLSSVIFIHGGNLKCICLIYRPSSYGTGNTLCFGYKNKSVNSWFQAFAAFYMLYAFFWVIIRRLEFKCRRFETLCLLHLHRQVDVSRMKLGIRKFLFLFLFCSHLPAFEDGTDRVFRNVGI
jgi:hypothetical protein